MAAEREAAVELRRQQQAARDAAEAVRQQHLQQQRINREREQQARPPPPCPLKKPQPCVLAAPQLALARHCATGGGDRQQEQRARFAYSWTFRRQINVLQTDDHHGCFLVHGHALSEADHHWLPSAVVCIVYEVYICQRVAHFAS